MVALRLKIAYRGNPGAKSVRKRTENNDSVSRRTTIGTFCLKVDQVVLRRLIHFRSLLLPNYGNFKKSSGHLSEGEGRFATFASAGTNNNIAVTVSGLTLTGSAANNYTLTQPTGLTANITLATLP